MTRPAIATFDPLRRTEWVVGGLVFVTVASTTWGFAGKASWAPMAFSVLAVLAALSAVVMTRREGLRFNGVAFLPFVFFALMISISLVNRSHEPSAIKPSGLIERTGWVAWLPATVDRATTVSEMLPWLSAFLLGAAIRQTAFGRRAVRLLWAILLGHGLLVALVGVYFFFVDWGHILGLVRARHGYHFASFVYRNHWSAYVLLLVALALGFAFSALRRWQGGRGRLDATVAGFGVAALLTLTIPMPGSRSGLLIAAGMLGVAVIRAGWVLWRARSAERSSPLVRLARVGGGLLLAGLILAGGVMLNRDNFRPHWVRTQAQISGLLSGAEDIRMNLSRDTLRLAADRPVWGWGVGSFGLVFPVYQGDYLRAPSGEITTQVLHAHNDWAELAAETGAVGLLGLLVPVVILLIRGARAEGVMGAWVTFGTGLVAAYALVDFPVHCPAVLFFLTVLLCTAPPPFGFPLEKEEKPLPAV